MLEAGIKKSLGEVMASELYAHNFYRNAANFMQYFGLFGAQSYFLKESADELTHYQKLVDYVNDLGEVIPVPMVEGCEKKSPKSLKEALDYSFEIEQALLDKYVAFYEKADTVTAQFLLQFIQIQRESVGEFGDLIARYKQGSDDTVILLDQYMNGL